MGDAKYYPDCWKEYVSFLKSNGESPSREWAIYAARYRAAGNYIDSAFFYLSEKLVRSYSEALRLLLCYSAYEAACKAAKLKVIDQVVLADSGFYKEAGDLLRKNFCNTPESEFPLRGALKDTRLADKIDDFFTGKDNNLLPIATAIRHLFAHGVWTPYGADVLTKTCCDGLNSLSQAILRESDKFLWEELEKQKELHS